MVFGAYRKDDFADPQMFLMQLGMLLERYPDKIVEQVTDPVHGIQSIAKFPPTIAECKQLCEDIVHRSGYAADWNKRAAEQLKEREKIEEENKHESLEHRKAVAERMLRKINEASRKPGPANVLVRPNVPQYAAMMERAKCEQGWREDEGGRGIWVPRQWLDEQPARRDTWRRYTAEELMAMYGPKQALPNQRESENVRSDGTTSQDGGTGAQRPSLAGE